MTDSLQARIDALTEQQETAEKQLITVEVSNALEIFTEHSKLNELIESVKSKVKTIVPDVYSEKGRKEIASMAYSVARTKTYLDSIGKELVDQYKELPKKIDSGRKFARDKLDLLRDEIREPLTLWEKEQEEIRLKLKIESDHVDAIEMHNEWLNRQAEKQELERLRQLERDRLIIEQIRREEDERAQRELDKLKKQHEMEIQAQKQRQLEADLELARAEQRRIDEIEAEKRRSAEQARIILEKQKRDNQLREEQEHRRLAEEQKRLADKKYREHVKQELIADLIANGLDESAANRWFEIIDQGHIRHLTIQY